MRKKFLAMYALAGALVASPIFTSCVDDSVSDSVEALRGAKVEALKAQAAYDKALGDAALINANANDAYYKAQAEYQKAQAAYRQAEAKAQELANQITEGRLEADLAAAIADAEQAKLEAEKNLAIAKIDAEKALEMAKWEAQQAFWDAEKTHAQKQAEYEKYLAGLANEDLRHAEKINGNIQAILNGDKDYYGYDTYGQWSQIRYYSKTYTKGNPYTSINGLIAGLVKEKVNLIELEYGLVDLKEYLAEEKEENDETIALNKALIEKYTELMGTSRREALVKEYEAAEEALAEIEAVAPEKALELYKAGLAKTEYQYAFVEDPIFKLIEDNCEYLTAKEAEKYEASYKNVAGETTPYNGDYEAVYEHSADDAEELAEAIANKEGDIADKEEEIEAKETEIAEKEEAIAEKEAEIAQVNVTDDQRELAIMEAEFAKEKEAYDKILASDGYKKYMADLEKAVADAQAAFDKTPTEELKEALEEAEEALENADYEYEEGKLLSEYTQDIEEAEADIESLKETIEQALGGLDEELGGLQEELAGLQEELAGLQEELEDLNTGEEGLEALKELQAMLAADSKEMKAYAELCKEYAALEKAWFDLDVENEELEANEEYWETLMSDLEKYIGDENSEGSLPDYASKIEKCEENIKEAERANEALVYSDNDGEGNEAAQEKLIADKKAEIAAMEAELEVRKAEYEAEVAALNALIGAEEE